MIVSHRFKFIFIKTTKTAGTSIETYLSPLCGEDDIVTPIYPPSTGHEPRNYGGALALDLSSSTPEQFRAACARHRYQNHMGAAELSQKLAPDVWHSYMKFCVERNPWDKTVSNYFMLRARGETPLDFESYVAAAALPSDLHKWYSATDRSLLVDKVLRYERLEEELAELFGELGVPFDNGLTPREKSGYRTDRRHYSAFFRSREARAKVEAQFRTEIELLGYSFEDGVSRDLPSRQPASSAR